VPWMDQSADSAIPFSQQPRTNELLLNLAHCPSVQPAPDNGTCTACKAPCTPSGLSVESQHGASQHPPSLPDFGGRHNAIRRSSTARMKHDMAAGLQARHAARGITEATQRAPSDPCCQRLRTPRLHQRREGGHAAPCTMSCEPSLTGSAPQGPKESLEYRIFFNQSGALTVPRHR
jgi:hypothetical protein